MPKNIIEYSVTRSFDLSSLILLESLIEYIEAEEVLDDEPPNSDCRDIPKTI